MNPETEPKPPDDEMLPEYDFSSGVRGKYAEAYSSGTNLVKIDPALMAHFRDAASINEALALLVKIADRKPS